MVKQQWSRKDAWFAKEGFEDEFNEEDEDFLLKGDFKDSEKEERI